MWNYINLFLKASFTHFCSARTPWYTMPIWLIFYFASIWCHSANADIDIRHCYLAKLFLNANRCSVGGVTDLARLDSLQLHPKTSKEIKSIRILWIGVGKQKYYLLQTFFWKYTWWSPVVLSFIYHYYVTWY